MEKRKNLTKENIGGSSRERLTNLAQNIGREEFAMNVLEIANEKVLDMLADELAKLYDMRSVRENKENIDPKSQKQHKGKAAPFGSAYKKALEESLKDWFGKEDWVRINTSGNIAGKCGTMKKGKPTTRCLPRKKAQSLSKAERKATVAKKVRGSKKGKQFVKNTEKAEFKKK